MTRPRFGRGKAVTLRPKKELRRGIAGLAPNTGLRPTKPGRTENPGRGANPLGLGAKPGRIPPKLGWEKAIGGRAIGRDGADIRIPRICAKPATAVADRRSAITTSRFIRTFYSRARG